MNAEKELLLALLIEKYTAPKVITPALHKEKTPVKNKKRRPHPIHWWDDWEKDQLMIMRDVEQLQFDHIAQLLGLRIEQVKSMYSLTSRQRAKQVQNVI